MLAAMGLLLLLVVFLLLMLVEVEVDQIPILPHKLLEAQAEAVMVAKDQQQAVLEQQIQVVGVAVGIILMLAMQAAQVLYSSNTQSLFQL